jgi:ribulose-5-phosphate 4-epimerase/fuculose-1-phosphate aldolase
MKPEDLCLVNYRGVVSFYDAHGVYEGFGGSALAPEEGENIARALGNGKVVILQNHSILAVAKAVDSATFNFRTEEILAMPDSWGFLKL